jgi:hypothetical protein
MAKKSGKPSSTASQEVQRDERHEPAASSYAPSVPQCPPDCFARLSVLDSRGTRFTKRQAASRSPARTSASDATQACAQ